MYAIIDISNGASFRKEQIIVLSFIYDEDIK